MITEMGSLYASNDPCSGIGYQTAPLLHGTLLKFRIRDNLDCNVMLSLDTLRGGIVVENPALTPTIVFQNLTPFHYASQVDVLPPTPNPMTWASVPAATGQTIAMTATTATDATTPPVQYLFTCTSGPGHSSSWQSSPIYTDTGLAANVTCTYTVQARDSVAVPNVTTASAPASATTDCFLSTFATYNDWVTMGKPACWCAPAKGSGYQCYGDIDGKVEGVGKFRVSNNDFTILMANWNKKITDATLNPCADVDHKSEGVGKFRVSLNDYNILISNWNKKDSQLTQNCGTKP